MTQTEINQLFVGAVDEWEWQDGYIWDPRIKGYHLDGHRPLRHDHLMTVLAACIERARGDKKNFRYRLMAVTLDFAPSMNGDAGIELLALAADRDRLEAFLVEVLS